jgi:hypothetical protein
VLPLAALAAFGSTFWIVAIRGAVGAVERTAPAAFPTWLRESTLMLPLYVFAVLAALTLALRWFGGNHNRPRMRGTRATVATFLLVVAATTLVATAVLVANAVYDYQLQATHLAAMNATHEPCNLVCVASQKHDAFILQARAIGFGAILILASNLVLLGLLVAFRGGRLNLTSTRPATPKPARFTNTDKFLLAGLLGTALVHATTVPDQLSTWPAAGIALLLLVIAQTDTALLYLLRLRTAQYALTAAVTAIPLLVWLYTHTAGLPLGPHAGNPQPLGLTDTALALLEATTLTVALTALHTHRHPKTTQATQATHATSTTGTPQHAARLALAGIIATAAIGLAGGLGLLAVTTTPSHTQHTQHNGPPTIVFGSTLKSANPDGR